MNKPPLVIPDYNTRWAYDRALKLSPQYSNPRNYETLEKFKTLIKTFERIHNIKFDAQCVEPLYNQLFTLTRPTEINPMTGELEEVDTLDEIFNCYNRNPLKHRDEKWFEYVNDDKAIQTDWAYRNYYKDTLKGDNQ